MATPQGSGQNQNAEAKPMSMMVMPNGAISMAPVGYVKVGGLTIPQATALLQKHYRKFVRNCTITLQPEKVTPDSFAIGGAVQAPGVYPFVFGSFRLTDAVATAKGFLSINNSAGERYELADLENAYIVRNGRILPVDFTEALVKRNPLHNIPIIDGDSINIPSLESGKVTVLGEITRQNCIPYQPNLTLLQAIAYCGGLKETNSRDVKVIRGGLKHPVVYTLDIRDIRYGRVMDFPLKPRDIVFVPRDGITEWNVLITQILPTIQVLNGLAGPFGSPSSFLYK
jgi:polysaccharide export outer membrane protein